MERVISSETCCVIGTPGEFLEFDRNGLIRICGDTVQTRLNYFE